MGSKANTHTHTLSQAQKLCRHGCCCQGDCPKCKGGVGAAGVLLAFASLRRRKQYVSKKSRRVNKPRERVCRLSMMSRVSLPADQSNFLLAVLMIDWKAVPLEPQRVMDTECRWRFRRRGGFTFCCAASCSLFYIELIKVTPLLWHSAL